MNCISLIDFLSKTPSLKINNSNKFHTTIGIIISLVTIILIASYSIYFMYNLIARKNYQILERYDNQIIPDFKIFDNKIAFTITDSLGKEYENPERLFDIEAQLRDYHYQPDREFSNFTKVSLGDCRMYNKPPFEKNFENLSNVWPTSKCINFYDVKKEYIEKNKDLKG